MMGRFLDATDIVDGRISASSYVTVSNLMQELHDKLSTDKALGATELKECFKLLKTGTTRDCLWYIWSQFPQLCYDMFLCKSVEVSRFVQLLRQQRYQMKDAIRDSEVKENRKFPRGFFKQSARSKTDEGGRGMSTTQFDSLRDKKNGKEAKVEADLKLLEGFFKQFARPKKGEDNE